MSADWLLKDGRPVAAATVLSHPEQLERLKEHCPEAAATAVLAGDPCYDRLVAALPERERFRRALGVGEGQRLVVLNSTWGPRSLFGDGAEGGGGGDSGGTGDLLPWLLPRLTGELPADEYRVAAVLHPNIWHGHGPGQVRAWLEGARRAGLTLVSPLEGWRQALIAADCVVGDHSSVTFYAAAIGRPVLLGAFPQEDLDPVSPVAELGRRAPVLRQRGSLRAQIDAAVEGHDPAVHAGVAAQTSSSPGRSAELLRRLFYGLMGLPEPQGRPALLERLPLPAYEPARRTEPVQVLTRRTRTGGRTPEVEVTRYCDPLFEPEGPEADGVHTAVDEETRDPGQLEIADVVVRYADADDPRLGPAAAWTAEVLARHRHCALAVYVDGPDRCTVRTRDGALRELSAEPGPDGRADLCDPAAYASAFHAWRESGEAVPSRLVVVTGEVRHVVRIEGAGRRRPD